MKALGIISIVMGHASWILPKTGFPIGPFVYTYHLMIFLFAAGFCFKKSSAENPFEYMGKRMRGMVPLFVLYSIFFVCIHNLLIGLHMIGSDQIYDFNTILTYISSSIVMVSTETLLGAFWFLPMLFLAVGFFVVTFHCAENQKYPIIFHIIFLLMWGCLGLYMNQQNLKLNYHMQTSMLGVPFLYAGYFAKCYREKLNRLINPVCGFVAAVIITLIINADIGIIELSVNSIINVWLFYPVSFLGIYLCASVAKLLMRNKVLTYCFSYIGRNSFHIMALHFLAFKIVDVIYGNLIHADASVLTVFPHSFELFIIYYIAGVALPLLFTGTIRKVYNEIKAKVINRKRDQEKL